MSRREPWSLLNPLILSAIVIAGLTVWVLVELGGWTYYTTAMRVRGYAEPHRVLRPTGLVAHPLGAMGLLLMMVPVVYALRKRWAPLARAGPLPRWLEAHILCGIVGPALITFHTSFKFNGLISVAYWSMVAVMLSGFVGRYLFVRIPKTIRGVELTHDEIRSRAEELTGEIGAASLLRPGMLERLREIEQQLAPAAGRAVVGPIMVRRRLRGLRGELLAAGVDRPLADRATAAMAERALLLRRLAYLDRRKRLFAMWHVFHLPLVYVMFAITTLHVGLAFYMGYGWR